MKKFNVVKLGRLSNPANKEPSMVYDGFSVYGARMEVLHPEVSKLRNREDLSDDEKEKEFETLKEKLEGETRVVSEDGRPTIGEPAWFFGRGMNDWLRTSMIKSYYVEDDGDNHPDKLVLPSEFPVEDVARIAIPKMNKGDMLLCTMNSIYYAQYRE